MLNSWASFPGFGSWATGWIGCRCHSRGSARATLSLAKFSQIARGEFVSILRPDLELAIREAVPRRVDLGYGRTVVAVGRAAAL